MIRAGLLSGVGLGLAACAPADLFLALPPLDAAQTLVLSVSGEGLDRAVVFDLSASRIDLRVPVDSGEELRFEAWLYERDLDALDLVAGELDFVVAPGGVALTRPDDAHVARFSGGELSEWEGQSTEVVVERGLRVSGAERCATFTAMGFPFGSSAGPTFGFALPSGEVLLGGPDGGLSLVTESGLVPVDNPLDESITNGSLEPSEPTAKIWLRSGSGALYFGPAVLPLELTRARTATIPSAIDIRAGLTARGEVELFVLEREGRLSRHVGEALSELYAFEPAGAFVAGRLARAGEGDALAAYISEPRAVRFQDGVVQASNLALQPFETLTSARWDGAYLVTTNRGAVLRFESSNWRELARGPDVDLLAIEPMPDGYFVVGGNGFAAQLVEGYGFCPPLAIGGAATHHASLLGGRDPVVIAGEPEVGAREARVTILRRN